MYTVVRHRSHKAMRHWQGQVIGCHKSPGPWVTAVKSCLSKHSVALSAAPPGTTVHRPIRVRDTSLVEPPDQLFDATYTRHSWPDTLRLRLPGNKKSGFSQCEQRLSNMSPGCISSGRAM